MRTYMIKRVSGQADLGRLNDLIDPQIWKNVPAAPIDHYYWENNGYRPEAEARLLWQPEGLAVRLSVREADPRITWHQHQDPVYEDSCLEIFLQPAPQQNRQYVNFELNAAGTLLLGQGENRHQRISHDASVISQLLIAPQVGHDSWSVTLYLPLSVLEQAVQPASWEAGTTMAANFYKCGNLTPRPHYGSWNPITSEQPDFHRPEDFGRLVLA